MDKAVEELTNKCEAEERKFYSQYWKHYSALEEKVMATDNYVTIDKDNYNTFSIEYDILLQAICSEIDVVAKRLCLEYDANSSANDIMEYLEIFVQHPDELENKKITLYSYNIELFPWKNISGFHIENGKKVRNLPDWWTGYNAIKHRRINSTKSNNEFTITERNIKKANLKNVLNALAALYSLEKACKDNMNRRFVKQFRELGSKRSATINYEETKCVFEQGIEFTVEE